MTRLIATLRNDVTVQVRNNLYTIGVGVALLIGIALSQLMSAEDLNPSIPVLMLLVVGGSTLLYIAGMIIFEKDEGTLNAQVVSPLRTNEYLVSKTASLTFLATLEGSIMIAIPVFWLSRTQEVAAFNPLILLVGILAIGVIYTLLGLILIVRYDSITDFLVPVLVIAIVLQLPFLHFMGLINAPAMLVIPTSAPTMLMIGAWGGLETWEWVYAIVYTSALIIGLAIWSYRAFQTHIIAKLS